MTRLEKIIFLNNILLDEMPQYKEQANSFGKSSDEQRILLRSLMNIRPPLPISDEFILVQDELLSEEVFEKGILKISDLTPVLRDDRIYLWQGDITRLSADAIVNAANSAMLGCFIPCHECIDNAIHSQAGLGLRVECDNIMTAQRAPEKTGLAKITKAYNLPSNFIIHTIGPIISGNLTNSDCKLLASCYESCLNLAIEKKLNSIAFPCISTGEFHFPSDRAAEIAIDTVLGFLKNTDSEIEVIFNVFKDIDYEIYRRLLGQDSPDKRDIR